MDKILLKKLSEKKEITKEEAQQAFNIVARYLNQRPELTFHLEPWNTKHENRYSINILVNHEYEDILVADTIRPRKL